MSDADPDLAALFAAEPAPARDDAFVDRVAAEVARSSRRRMRTLSAAGLAFGLGGGAVLALLSPFLGEAGRAVGQALQAPGMTWTVVAAAVLLGVGLPLWRAR